MQYARLDSGVVIEIIVPPAGVEIGDMLHPDIVSTLTPAGAEVALGWHYDGDVFSAPPVPVVTTADLLAYAAMRRWCVETGGVNVSGTLLATDRESTGIMLGAVVWATMHPAATRRWKALSGWVTLSAEQIIALGNAVAAHVQAAFDTEDTVVAGITAGTITTMAEIDAAAWPPND